MQLLRNPGQHIVTAFPDCASLHPGYGRGGEILPLKQIVKDCDSDCAGLVACLQSPVFSSFSAEI
jgi:hypothetical protein